MRIPTLTCAAALMAVPASAQALGPAIELLPGHPVYHEREREAGLVMAISITQDHAAHGPNELCEELRVAAGLERHRGAELPLEVIFVVPYKGMAIEGYYLPTDAALGGEALVRGKEVARSTLDAIVERAGIPARLLDEPAVEQEISCELGAPAWLLHWQDIRPVGGDGPDPVIESAYRRFMTIHRSIVEHTPDSAPAAKLQAQGFSRATRSVALTDGAPAPGTVPQAVPSKP